MSKSCKEKLCCQVCSLMHPTLLHMKRRDDAGDQEVKLLIMLIAIQSPVHWSVLEIQLVELLGPVKSVYCQ